MLERIDMRQSTKSSPVNSHNRVRVSREITRAMALWFDEVLVLVKEGWLAIAHSTPLSWPTSGNKTMSLALRRPALVEEVHGVVRAAE